MQSIAYIQHYLFSYLNGLVHDQQHGDNTMMFLLLLKSDICCPFPRFSESIESDTLGDYS